VAGLALCGGGRLRVAAVGPVEGAGPVWKGLALWRGLASVGGGWP
jgi:hypothetical protein